jgi:hypothetical protein
MTIKTKTKDPIIKKISLTTRDNLKISKCQSIQSITLKKTCKIDKIVKENIFPNIINGLIINKISVLLKKKRNKSNRIDLKIERRKDLSRQNS